MQFFKYTIVLTPEKGEPDTYNISVPALPEVVTFGESLEEARFMAQDALELVILSRLEEGEKIPPDKRPTKVPKNSKIEELVVTVYHQVTASPAAYVKNALSQSS